MTESESVKRFRKLIEAMSQGGGNMSAHDYSEFLYLARTAADHWDSTIRTAGTAEKERLFDFGDFADAMSS